VLCEQAIQNITGYFDEHYETAIQFKKESLENFKNVKEASNYLYQNLNDELQKKFLDSKTNQSLEVKDLKNIHNEISKNLEGIRRKFTELEAKAIPKRIQFESNLQNMTIKSVGKFQVRDLFLEKIIEKQQTIKFYDVIDRVDAAQIDENMNFFCVKSEKKHQSVDFKLILLTKERNEDLIKKTRENKITSNYENPRIISIELFKISKTFNFLVNFQFSSTKGTEEKSEIYCFDENLVLKKKIVFEHPIKNIAVYSDCFFCLWFSKHNNCKLLSIFDENFLNKNTIGQPKEDLPFFFNRSIREIEVNDTYNFLLADKIVLLMKRSDGIIVKKVEINTNNFFLFMDKFILTFNQTTLICYDFEGKISHEGKYFTDDTHLLKSSNDKLIFFDRSKFELICCS
jgi:hypothetical protein